MDCSPRFGCFPRDPSFGDDLLGLYSGLVGCTPTVRNCPIIAKSPSSNIYDLDYKLLIPADCPIPLASPGTENEVRRRAGH
ncbi:MAG: hypothetical protein KY444_02120 [Gemmatimonadetes bacterium]|nr:hypothetical protein [Gemmatimonadota bacterium]